MWGALAAVGLLLWFQACGLCAARLALPEESPGVRLLLGSVCGSLMLQWFPVLFAFFLGFSVPAHLLAMCLALGCAAACLWAGRGRPGFSGVGGLFRRRKFLWLVFGAALLFALLVWKSFLFEDGKIFSSQATYGDMSMHLSFITSIARQGEFPPEYSLLPGCLLSYPFLGDSVSSSLYLLDAPLKWAYFLPMALAGFQVFFGFYLFASRLMGSAGKAAFAWVLFFFNGGFGFVYFLGSREDFTRIFTKFYQTPTNLVDRNIRWVNVIVDMMLPQRATLFGWAVLFPALYLLYRAAFEGKKRYFLYAGIFAGLLPMIHTHSFVALAVICGAWLHSFLLRGLSLERAGARVGRAAVLLGLPCMVLIQQLLRRNGKLDSSGLLWFALSAGGLFILWLCFLVVKAARRGELRALAGTWGILLITACALALPQLCFWTFRQIGNGSFLRGHFGWSLGEENYLTFYLKNLGLAGVLAFFGLLTAKDREFSKYSPALFLWFLAEFVEFQPNDYDNNKLLYAAFALLCCAAAESACRLLGLVKSRGLRGTLAAAGTFVCVCSAALTLGREAVAKYELFGESAIALCEFVEETVPPDAVILTDTRHNNEIAALTGRNIVCGSPAYLYYHGLPYGKNEALAQRMYEEPEQSENWFREFSVDYVLVSDFERSSYQVDEEAIDRMFTKVYDDGVRRLYRTGLADAKGGSAVEQAF